MSNHSSSVAKDDPGGQVAPRGELQALLARVEAATGPDSKLDYDLADAIDPSACIPLDRWDFTHSFDAALALVERVLPRWRVALNSDDHRWPRWTAEVKPSGVRWDGKFSGYAKTAPLALMAALLRALHLDQAEDGGRPVPPHGSGP